MKSKSVIICYVMTCGWLAVLTGLCVFAPTLMKLYVHWRHLPQEVSRGILIAFYLCCVPAYTAIFCLLRILKNIRELQMFNNANSRLLRLVSWCCMAVAVITFAAGFLYFPLFFITAAMLFIFLIVRVVCSCFIAAAELREENRLTI